MTIPTYRSSRPAECVEPRAHRDPSQRFATYGKVQSMDDELTPFGFIKSLGACLLLIAAAWGLIIAFS